MNRINTSKRKPARWSLTTLIMLAFLLAIGQIAYGTPLLLEHFDQKVGNDSPIGLAPDWHCCAVEGWRVTDFTTAIPEKRITRSLIIPKDWLLPRVLELTYTAWDLEAFAQDCLDEANSDWGLANGAEGYVGYWQRYSRHSPFAIHQSPPPFRWDEERRFLLRCELDAAFFHLYLGASSEWGMANGREANSDQRMANSGTAAAEPHSPLATHHSPLLSAFPTPRHAVDYILDTFPIVKRKDEAKFNGDYRTKRTILEIYDALAEAQQRMANGERRMEAGYQTRLDPPPADPRCCHSQKSDQTKL